MVIKKDFAKIFIIGVWVFDRFLNTLLHTSTSQPAFTCSPLASFCFPYYWLWTFSTPCSSVSVVNFEHVITGWDLHRIHSLGYWKQNGTIGYVHIPLFCYIASKHFDLQILIEMLMPNFFSYYYFVWFKSNKLVLFYDSFLR